MNLEDQQSTVGGELALPRITWNLLYIGEASTGEKGGV